MDDDHPTGKKIPAIPTSLFPEDDQVQDAEGLTQPANQPPSGTPNWVTPVAEPDNSPEPPAEAPSTVQGWGTTLALQSLAKTFPENTDFGRWQKFVEIARSMPFPELATYEETQSMLVNAFDDLARFKPKSFFEERSAVRMVLLDRMAILVSTRMSGGALATTTFEADRKLLSWIHDEMTKCQMAMDRHFRSHYR